MENQLLQNSKPRSNDSCSSGLLQNALSLDPHFLSGFGDWRACQIKPCRGAIPVWQSAGVD